MQYRQSTVYNFDKKRLEGEAGERLLVDLYPNDFKHYTGGYETDLIYIPENKRVELKTDKWFMHRTDNFFMEKFSDTKTKKLGGPWRALKEKNDWFIYLFINNNTMFIFKDLVALVNRVEYIIERDKRTLTDVINDHHVTLGYPMARDEFKDLYTAYEIEI
jgi:hypothetical protein